MRLLIAAVLALTVMPSARAAFAEATAPEGPKVHTVTIDASAFSPASLTVSPGDIVLFRNNDMFPHTATARAGAFDSREIQPGKTWRLETPKRGRLFEYYCVLHPTMKGALRVTSRP